MLQQHSSCSLLLLVLLPPLTCIHASLMLPPPPFTPPLSHLHPWHPSCSLLPSLFLPLTCIHGMPLPCIIRCRTIRCPCAGASCNADCCFTLPAPSLTRAPVPASASATAPASADCCCARDEDRGTRAPAWSCCFSFMRAALLLATAIAAAACRVPGNESADEMRLDEMKQQCNEERIHMFCATVLRLARLVS